MKIFWDQCGQAGWDDLCNRARAPLQQRWNYGEIHTALGGQVIRAVIHDKEEPVALCQFICRRFGGVLNVSLATRGPLWLAPCDRRAALALFRRSLPLPFPCAKLLTTRENNARLIRLMTPTTNAQVSLPVHRSTLHGKWRNALKKAHSSNLRVRHIVCPQNLLLPLLEMDKKQQGVKSYQALPIEFTLNWHRIAPDDLRLISVSQSGTTVANALFIRHGNTATYHIANSTDLGRKVSAGRLALWHAFSEFEKQGVRSVDLGQIDTVNAAGLARFKLGAGATAQQNGATVLAI